MRTGIEIEVAAGDRLRLEAITAGRNRRQRRARPDRMVPLSAAALRPLASMTSPVA